MTSRIAAFLLACLVAGAAAATEIALEFNETPVYTIAHEYDDAWEFVRWSLDGLEVELHASGPGAGPLEYPSAFYLGLNCGYGLCLDYVATFSGALSVVSVDFAGILDLSGFDAADPIVASGYFLKTYSGENGTGDLLGSAIVPQVPVSAQPGDFIVMPATLEVTAPAIRSIVFGSTTSFLEVATPGNIAVSQRIRMTVPEPASALLVGAGLVALVAGRPRGTTRAERRS